jgi:hypothetical protein
MEHTEATHDGRLPIQGAVNGGGVAREERRIYRSATSSVNMSSLSELCDHLPFSSSIQYWLALGFFFTFSEFLNATSSISMILSSSPWTTSKPLDCAYQAAAKCLSLRVLRSRSRSLKATSEHSKTLRGWTSCQKSCKYGIVDEISYHWTMFILANSLQ